MITCPSCGRGASDDDRFCRGCGRELPAAEGHTQQTGKPLIVATLGPTTSGVGKTISYENQQFDLLDVGPITAEAILELDRQGHLVWAYAGLREWVQGLLASDQAAPAKSPSQGGRDTAIGRDAKGPADWSDGENRGSIRGRGWVRPVVLVVALVIVAGIATVLEGGYARDGAGITFTLLGLVLLAVLVWILVKPKDLRSRLANPSPSSSSSRWLPATLAGLCAVSLVLAAALWWMPHYQVIVPADKRLILDSTPEMTVKVKNHGLFSGTYIASYKVAGQEQSVVELDLAPGEERAVSLAVAPTTSRVPHLLELGSTEILAQILRPAKFHVSALKADPAIAKVNQGVDVQASVENVGDVAGVFPGTIEANGQEIDAQPTTIEPGVSTTLTFQVSQGSAGRCRLKLGNAQKTVMAVRPVRPPNGDVLRRRISDGNAKLTVKNLTKSDAMVILTRTSAQSSPVLAVYVHKGNKATVDGIPDGKYIVWDCTGRDWNAYTRDFLTTDARSRWRDLLVFSTTYSTSYSSDSYYRYTTRHTAWTNYTLTLGKGSAKYASVTSASHFPKL